MSRRKISSHFAFCADGSLIKYPVITFSNGQIDDISSSSSLIEEAGLEFYSGVLFPLFIDRLSLCASEDLVEHSSLKSSLVSRIILQENRFDLISQLPLAHVSKLIKVQSISTPLDGKYDSLPLIERISELVKLGYFRDYLEAFQYYTSYNQLKSEISIGARSEFVLCSDLVVVKGGRITSSMFRVIR